MVLCLSRSLRNDKGKACTLFLYKKCNSRKSSFASQFVHGRKEKLKTVKALFALDGNDGVSAAFATIMPTARGKDGVFGDVLAFEKTKAGVGDELLGHG